MEYVLGWALDAAMRDPVLRAPLFHLVDVLPSLTHPSEIAQHAAALMVKSRAQAPVRSAVIGLAARLPILSGVLAHLMRAQTEFLGKRFIVGTNLADATASLASMHKARIGFSLDVLGEATHSDREGEEFAMKYQTMIHDLANETERWPYSAILQESPHGSIPIGNVSVKVSALDPRLDPVATEASVARLYKRLRPIVARCKERNIFLNLDMESWDLHEITLQTFERLAMDDEFRKFRHMGMVLQAYLRNSFETAERIIALARTRGTPFTVRLVKGAYWDYEVAHARQYGYECPVFENKSKTDAQYERITALLLHHHELVATAFASHNIRSIAHAIVQAERLNVPRNGFEIQMLNGAARPERDTLRDRGIRIRIYAPLGDLLPGMAYLVRRLLENSANTGFLRQAYQEHSQILELLKPPADAA